MIKLESPVPSPEPPTLKPSLADLSRNSSVISSSSSSSSTASLVLPVRPRPIRTFSSPRSRSPGGPPTPRASRPPAYITREFGLTDHQSDALFGRSRANSKSKSRSSSANGRLGVEDFVFGEVLGEGSYSTVIHGIHRTTRQEYAIKVLDKGHLKRNNKLSTALAEKNTLVRLGSGHPGIVRLHWAFQDEWSLYFVLDLARNGELQSRISRMGSLSTTCARYYAAQLVDALDYMHTRGVIHRDLKPENLLLDDDFRIKVTDFGTGKLIDVPPERATKTFVGTAQYVSPELLEANETSKRYGFICSGARSLPNGISDQFGFGSPSISRGKRSSNSIIPFPENFDPEAADLVRRLLVRDPLERLGAGPPEGLHSMEALRSHTFFSSIRWDTLWDDPPPPLETGLVRRESAPVDEWDDVGAAWDELVSSPDGGDDDDDDDESIRLHTSSHLHARLRAPGDDGIEWAPDAQAYVSPPAVPPEEIGPHGEMPDYARQSLPLADIINGIDAVDAVDALVAHSDEAVNGGQGIRFVPPDFGGASNNTITGAGEDVRPIPSPDTLSASPGPGSEKDKSAERDSPETTSTETWRGKRRGYGTVTSGPVEKLGAALEAMGIHRGRLRTRSPTPARGVPSSAEALDWELNVFTHRSSVLSVGEKMLFHAPVEETALKRRTSRLLLPLPVSQRKPKARELALTSHRLLCLKALKSGRGVGVKAELGLGDHPSQPAGSGREKRTKGDDARRTVTGVERRGVKEFVVLTTAKSGFFVAESEAAADAWVQRIAEALRQQNSNPVQSREPKPSNMFRNNVGTKKKNQQQ
ncbi:kinase-like protein [Russula earlei]|uniref:Kinase-like protein n=1 Tax=Russula earlei TaxID=71964 RepID=A0ACC0U1H3_9AGAM|nr:kinase-like protein [Russula earlei]